MNHSTAMYHVKNIIYITVRRLDHYEDKEEIINIQFMKQNKLGKIIDVGISYFSEKKVTKTNLIHLTQIMNNTFITFMYETD